MTGSELRAIRERFGFSLERIAMLARTSVEKVAEWELGDRRVSRSVERRLRELIPHLEVGDEVKRRLEGAGVEQCAWLEQQTALTMAAFAEHARTCSSCAARDRITKEVLRERGMSEGPVSRTLLGGVFEFSAGELNVSPWVAWLVAGGLVLFFVGLLSRAHSHAEEAPRVGLLSALAWVVGVGVTWVAVRLMRRGA